MGKEKVMEINVDLAQIRAAAKSTEDLSNVHLSIPVGDPGELRCNDVLFTITANPAEDGVRAMLPSTFRYYAINELRIHTLSTLAKEDVLTINGDFEVPLGGSISPRVDKAFFFNRDSAEAVCRVLTEEELKRLKPRIKILGDVQEMLEDQLKNNKF